MDKKTTLQEAFKIIANAGESNRLFLKAIEHAENNQFGLAEEQYSQATLELNNAHNLQTNLIQAEVKGEGPEYSLIMVHAQDHLMNGILIKDLTKSIIKLHQKIIGDKNV